MRTSIVKSVVKVRREEPKGKLEFSCQCIIFTKGITKRRWGRGESPETPPAKLVKLSSGDKDEVSL